MHSKTIEDRARIREAAMKAQRISVWRKNGAPARFVAQVA